MLGLTPFEKRGYDLFDAFHDFEKNFFENSSAKSFNTDIKDNGDSYELTAEMPGFDKDDIHIDIEDGYLIIKAEHKDESGDKDDKGNYIRRERFYGSYQRSFDITGVDADKIEASYKNGVLSLNMPKKAVEEKTTKRLEIK